MVATKNKTCTLPAIGPFCPAPNCGVKQQPKRATARFKPVEVEPRRVRLAPVRSHFGFAW